ncbi:MAG: FRG domain-containing protein [bacterium]
MYRAKYYIGKEKDILTDIRKHNYSQFAEQDLFINELFKMQHYGIPTSFLDWTKNPLNALFFTVSDEF